MHARKLERVTLTGNDRYGAQVEADGATTREAVRNFMDACRLSEQVYEQIAGYFVDSTVTTQQVAVLDASRPARQTVPPMTRGHIPPVVEPTL